MKPLLFYFLMFLFAIGVANLGFILDESDGYLRLKYALGVGR